MINHEPSNNDWLQTFTAKRFYPMAPRSEDVDIRDIAHGLSQICRFSGQCRDFYSVAEHSVIVAGQVALKAPSDYWQQLRALLHDASEAYLLDIPRPVKLLIPNYKEAENRVSLVIAEALHIPGEGKDTELINSIDKKIVADEVIALMSNPDLDLVRLGVAPEDRLNASIYKWVPKQAEINFLTAYKTLLIKLSNSVGT